MIKIAYLSDYPFSIGFGGKEIQMLSYLNLINKNALNIRVQLFNWWDINFLNDVDIIHFFGCYTFRHLIKQLMSNKKKKIKIFTSPTIYYENNWKFSNFAFILGKILPIPNFYNNIIYQLENSDVVIVNSESEKNFIVKNITKKANIHIIYNAVEDDFNIIEPEKENVFLKQYNLQKDSYILSVGMLDERKNTISMIKAFLNVSNIINKKLVLIGKFRFSKKENSKLAEKLLEENKDKIVYIPYLDRKIDIDLLKSAYFNCAYHILPSFIETPGIANLEALYFGKNIIVGDCSPVKEYFGENAIYCDPYETKSIEKAILKCNELPYYNPCNVKLIKDKYVYSIVIKKLIEIYSS